MMITGTEHLLHGWGLISDGVHTTFTEATKQFAL